MAKLYINSMKDALKKFHKDVLVDDYNYLTQNVTKPLPDAFYEALAWQGLKDHGVKVYTDCPDCVVPVGGVGVNNTNYAKMIFGVLYRNLTQEELSWLSTHKTEVQKIYEFLSENNNSEEAKVFVREIINSGLNGSLINAFPFFKYPPSYDYASRYPKLTEYLKNQIPKLKDNNIIISKLVEYGDLDEETIKNHLNWGEGPIIEIVQLDDFCNDCSSLTYGIFDAENPEKIYLDIDLVNDLENSTLGSELADAFAFLIGVTILHEYVHFSEYTDFEWNSPESGLLFETDVYGQTVWRKMLYLY